MSDMLRRMANSDAQLRLTEAKESHSVRPPFTTLALGPHAATVTVGAFPQAKTVLVLAFRVAIFVSTTNDGANFWTIALTTTAAATIASFTTAAIAPNVWTRFAVTTGIVQPGAANVAMLVSATKTLAPGTIYVIPEVLLLEQT